MYNRLHTVLNIMKVVVYNEIVNRECLLEKKSQTFKCIIYIL